MSYGTDIEAQVSTRSGAMALGLAGLRRFARYPVASVIIVLAFALLGKGLGFLLEAGVIGYSIALILGVVLGITISLASIALMTMSADDLPELGGLCRTGVLIATGLGVGLSLPIAAAAYLVPDTVWARYMVAWLPGQVPYLFATIGPVLLFSMLPALLVAWPIRARHDTDLDTSIRYVWQKFENRRYRQVDMTLLIAGIGSILCFAPLFVFLAPALLAQLSAACLEQFAGDIVVHDE